MRTILLLVGLAAVASIGLLALGDKLRLSALAILSQSYNDCVALIKEEYADVGDIQFDATEHDLNADGINDLIVKLVSEETCGTAGCLFEFCLSSESGEVEFLQFGYAAQTIQPMNTVSSGMRDIEVNSDSTIRLTWDGRRYTLAE